MDPNTRHALAAINRRFYEKQAEAFSASRESSWRGWDRILAAVSAPGGELKVLDVGCGNGRFARHLAQHWRGRFRYLGIDASGDLLARASERNPRRDWIDYEQRDFLEDSLEKTLPEGPYDLIALFGVLHHVPGFDLRRELVAALAARLAPSGSLALSVWRFGAFERFRRRIVPWETYNLGASQRVETSQLEPGDYLLRFGEDADPPRYCHYSDDEETKALLEGLPIQATLCFDADGRSDCYNRYLLLRRSDPS
jgi:SAM-dependent methyltransferase